MRPVRSHVFRGRRYQIRWKKLPGEVAGFCHGPNVQGKQIVLDPRVRGKDELRVLIDESLHATCWDLDNESVAEISRDIASLLWRLNYRRHP